jgi:hypothetical protein
MAQRSGRRVHAATAAVLAVAVVAACGNSERTTSTGEPRPPLSRDECDRRFDALDDSCAIDEDCAVAVRWQCGDANGGPFSSPALGIHADELEAFDELAKACGMPSESSDCPSGEGHQGIAPVAVDVDPTLGVPVSAITAGCRSGRCTTFWTLCGNTCGDGARDSCRIEVTERGPRFVPAPENSNDPETYTEHCDGDDFGAQSCASRGHGSGALACTEQCTIDEGACRVCAEPDDTLLACEVDPSDTQPQELLLAASDNQLAALWVGETRETLTFALYENELGAPTAERLVPLEHPLDEYDTISVAPVPDGWLVAVGERTAQRVRLYHADASGTFAGEPTVLEGVGESALLVPRASGVPLLLAQALTDSTSPWSLLSLRADFSGSDGSVELGSFDPAMRRSTPNAVFAGSNVLVAATAENEVHVLRVDPDDLALLGDIVLPGTDSAYGHHYLAPSGDGAVLFSDLLAADESVAWVHLDAAGAPRASAVVLSPTPALAFLGPVASVGDHSFIPARGETGLELVRLEATGNPLEPVLVAAGPGAIAGTVGITVQGGDVVVGAPSQGGLLLARIAP